MRGFGNASDPNLLNTIVELRKEDIFEQDSYNEKFLLARKVSRVPSSATDVLATDKVGDWNWTSSFIYILLEISAGVFEWRTSPMTNFTGGGGGGETNTSSNSGAGDGLALPKVGVDMPFKSLTAGTNITLTASATEIEINSTGGGSGETNTSSNSGTGAGLALPKVGVDMPFKSLTAGSNITITESATEIELAVAPEAERTISDNTTLLLTDNYIFVNTLNSTITVTLPTAVGNSAKVYTIKTLKTNFATIVNPIGSEKIDDIITKIVTAPNALKIVSDGIGWRIV